LLLLFLLTHYALFRRLKLLRLLFELSLQIFKDWLRIKEQKSSNLPENQNCSLVKEQKHQRKNSERYKPGRLKKIMRDTMENGNFLRCVIRAL